MLKVTVYRKSDSKRPNLDRIKKRVANVVGDKHIVGEGIAECLRGVSTDQRVEIVMQPAIPDVLGQPANRIRVEQTALVDGQMILTGHKISDRLQREITRAINEGFKSAQPRSSFIYKCADCDSVRPPPKRQFGPPSVRPPASAQYFAPSN
ncbi:MAG: hypothetical protein ABH846_04715 [Patescibacteria group bacterium]